MTGFSNVKRLWNPNKRKEDGALAAIRVLQIMPAMDTGGMETFVMNLYRSIDREKVQFDFLYHYDKPCFYDREILSLGGQITKLTVRQDNNLPRYLRELREFFTAHPEYRVIHGHYSGFGMFYNTVARKCGVPVRAGHSHNTAYEHNLVGQLDRVMSSQFDRELTDRFACSQRAGEMLYGSHPFKVLPNGVNTALFARHDPADRAALRKELGVAEDEILFGHVGRFTQQKNHAGLLTLFASLKKEMPRARLVLVGGGALEQQVRQQAKELGLENSVIFAGVRGDMQRFYHAMDVFLLPSLFEGLPVVLVEAQAAGLPCFVSDTVDPGAAFAKNIHYLPLNDTGAWVQSIVTSDLSRDPDARSRAIEAGFDVRTSAQYLQNFYLEQYAAHSREGEA